MTLSIDLTPDLELRLAEMAARNGMPLSECVRVVLTRGLDRTTDAASRPFDATTPQSPFYFRATTEEWQKAFNTWVEAHRDDSAPALPADALRREKVYDDRGV